MKYILNITPEELLKKDFYEDYSEDEPLKFKEGEGIFDSKVYYLEREEGFVFLFEEMTYGWRLNFKTTWLGTNSDNFFIGDIAINILGQMLEQKVIRFDSNREE